MTDFVSPATQAMNVIREIGDKISQTGEPIHQYPVSDKFSVQLIEELTERGIVKIASFVRTLDGTAFMGVNLTLDGWKQYEAEKRGDIQGNYGFLAMKFGDRELDSFIKNTVKPAVKNGLGYDLVDMRNVARAGIIDNVMRVEIRNSAFVIADLTHDNLGAYWEAGYAEGLGKAVIYICEKEKFERQNTHFDTNHCTTVLWSTGDEKEFCDQLIATLRRSLDYSP